MTRNSLCHSPGKDIIVKRIAIVTITNSGPNFGNRLQNYALQTVLERLGCIPETIFTANIIRRSIMLSRLRWLARKIIKRTRRQYYFDRFNKLYIHAARRIRYRSLNDNAFAKDGYDAAIVGSDQVWNPEFDFNTDFEYLPFMPPEKRYAYAASFGVDRLPPTRREAVAGFLREMREISVREDTGRTLVKELTGRDVPVVVDPTLLLESSDFEAIAEKPPQSIPERYVLTYLRGEQTAAGLALIKETAEALGIPIITINERRDTAFYNIGPQHFLYLFRNAEYVFADSFHATVFSIIFHRPFTCFHRQGNNRIYSRIDTLLRVTQLENRLFDTPLTAPALSAIDFTSVDRRIAAERERAMEFLRDIRKQW